MFLCPSMYRCIYAHTLSESKAVSVEVAPVREIPVVVSICGRMKHDRFQFPSDRLPRGQRSAIVQGRTIHTHIYLFNIYVYPSVAVSHQIQGSGTGKIGHDRFFLDEQRGEGAPRGGTGSLESLGSLGGVWMTDLRRNNKEESVLRTHVGAQ